MNMAQPPLSRDQRRALKRQERKRSKPASRHSTRITNTIESALIGISALPKAQQEKLRCWTAEAFEALRMGKGEYDHWAWFQSTLNILTAVNQTTCLRDMDKYIKQCEQSLVAIFVRAAKGASPYVVDTPDVWNPTALYAQELDDIRLIIELQDIAFAVVPAREWNRAIAKAKGRAMAKRNFVR